VPAPLGGPFRGRRLNAAAKACARSNIAWVCAALAANARRRKFAIMVFPATGDRHRCGSGKDLTEARDYLKNSG